MESSQESAQLESMVSALREVFQKVEELEQSVQVLEPEIHKLEEKFMVEQWMPICDWVL